MIHKIPIRSITRKRHGASYFRLLAFKANAILSLSLFELWLAIISIDFFICECTLIAFRGNGTGGYPFYATICLQINR